MLYSQFKENITTICTVLAEGDDQFRKHALELMRKKYNMDNLIPSLEFYGTPDGLMNLKEGFSTLSQFSESTGLEEMDEITEALKQIWNEQNR